MDMGEARLADMDRCGIDVSVLSSSMGIEQLPADAAIRVCRATNDALYALIQRYPGRFLGSAVLPVHDVPAACAELDRCVREYGFVCWHTHSNYGIKAPDQKEFRPIFEKCEALGVYVYLHPHFLLQDRIEDYGFGLSGPALGFTLDTVTTIMRMILSGLFDEYPKLKVVLGHLGEAIPFLLERIDNRIAFIRTENEKNQHPVSYYFKNNIWVTTSGNMSKSAFQCTKEVLGMSRIAFGSDYPYEDLDDMNDFIENLPLGRDEREMLYNKNAIDFLDVDFDRGSVT